MEKAIGAFLGSAVLALTLLSGCSQNSGVQFKATGDVVSEQVSFAQAEITDAVRKAKAASEASGWSIAFEALDASLGEQAYAIAANSSSKSVSIRAGDLAGAMYGGLEVAEMIRLGGFSSLENRTGTPYIKKRGLKFNAPLDMRTPSYSDVGDSAQQNIETMWDLSFWKAEFDEMARQRLNVFSLWNLNPFPSMVKVPEYPDVALADVWRTKSEFDDTYSTIAADMVREEFWSNYEVVKTISIDQKIAFWKEVMAYAHHRGIEFDLYTWNIYTFGEHGKDGITSDIRNETTKAYFRASVRELVKTYPDLDNIGVTSGEYMNDGNAAASIQDCDMWLHDTYGEGIKDALSGTSRKVGLIHRLHWSDMATINKNWADFPYSINFSSKYSRAHMYSSVTPHLMDEDFAALPAGQKLWLEVRNDDSFNYRWGDPDYARGYVSNMPVEKIGGYLIGSDGYVPGKEHANVDNALNGELFLKKHWFNFMLFGRLGYDPKLDNARFAALAKDHFSSISPAQVETMLAAMASASKIVPEMTKLYFRYEDMNWYPEACTSHSAVFGFLTIKRFLKSDDAMEGQGILSINDYCEVVEKNALDPSLITPLDIRKNLQTFAEAAQNSLDGLGALPSLDMSEQSREFNAFVSDQQAVVYLGLYYVAKIEAIIDLRLYNDTGTDSYKSAAIAAAQNGLAQWKRLAAAFSAHYNPQRLGREGWLDPVGFTSDVEAEVKQCETWTPHKA